MKAHYRRTAPDIAEPVAIPAPAPAVYGTRLLRELMKVGTIPFHRAGRRVVLDAVEVDEAIRRNWRQAA